MLSICSFPPGSSAQSTAMGRLCITALLPLALVLLVLLVHLPPSAAAPQRQPQAQVEAEAQPGLDDIYNFKCIYILYIREIIVPSVSKLPAE